MANGIEIRDLNFGYEAKRIFDHYSLRIEARQSVALARTTGCGKITLVDLIFGLQKPESGVILVDTRDISTNLRSWHRKSAYVPQFIYLLDDTVRANVASGEESDQIDDLRMRESLFWAQMWADVTDWLEGVNTLAGNRGVKLSGWQHQRLWIARALYRYPSRVGKNEAD